MADDFVDPFTKELRLDKVVTIGTRPNTGTVPPSGSNTIEERRVILRPFEFDHPSPAIREEFNNPSNILHPIYKAGGMVMTYTPTISETSSINYTSSDIMQSNEAFNVYTGTTNRTINISNIVFTCETPAQGVYALSVIHFLRSYSMVDFGAGRSGRPPSPMWFSAFGKYAYDKVPVILNGYGFKSSNPEIDFVPVANPGNETMYPQYKEIQNIRTGDHKSELKNMRSIIDEVDYNEATWVPIKLEIEALSLTVQHTPLYWKTFNLDDYKTGKMADNSEDWLW